jgi:E2F/DP family winged-helix DNA-binding domain
MGSKDHQVINLEQAVRALHVRKRRIYDIVNILESIRVMKRISKNNYKMKAPEFIKKRIKVIEVSLIYIGLIQRHATDM